MKSIVFTFGRMNPPTKGHERLISKVVETAKNIGGDHIVYLSQTHNNTTDPLDWDFKRRVCESTFRGVNISNDETLKTPFMALQKLTETYNDIKLVVGGDRVEEFRERMTKYAIQWGSTFEVVSAGDRLQESAGVEGISASRQQSLALMGMKDKFMEGMPTTMTKNVADLCYRKIRSALK
jgi:nicotinic acid mononucleotide adenylyltransferase